MNLRNLLRRATELQVAPPKARNTQLQGLPTATADATRAQQPAALSGGCVVSGATSPATSTQPDGFQACNSMSELHVASDRTCNTQLGSLTVHRLPGELIRTINAACTARCDDEANRVALIDECLTLPPAMQEDIRQHFAEVARIWEKLK